MAERPQEFRRGQTWYDEKGNRIYIISGRAKFVNRPKKGTERTLSRTKTIDNTQRNSV